MERSARIFVAGGWTLIGAAICRTLRRHGYTGVTGEACSLIDLTDAGRVDAFFARAVPEYVFMTSVKSGGIRANQKYPAELMRDNLLATCNVLECAHRYGVKKLLYLASSCVYPKLAPQPIAESSLMAGPVEPTSEAYALAKLAGIKLCEAYRQQYGWNCVSAIPGDVFGPGDHFDAEDSHVIPALIRKMHEAKTRDAPDVEIWGTGTPRRDFIFVNDVAEASLLLMREYDSQEPINIGSGMDRSIQEIAERIRKVVGYNGRLHFDTGRPDGTPLKRLDSSKLMAMGWQPTTSLGDALVATYRAFLQFEREKGNERERTVLSVPLPDSENRGGDCQGLSDG